MPVLHGYEIPADRFRPDLTLHEASRINLEQVEALGSAVAEAARPGDPRRPCSACFWLPLYLASIALVAAVVWWFA